MRYIFMALILAASCSMPSRLDRITLDAKGMRPISVEDMLWLREEAGLNYPMDNYWNDSNNLTHAQIIVLMLCEQIRHPR